MGKKREAFELHVVIPANTTATIYLPSKKGATIRESGKVRTGDINFEKEQAVIKTGSGDYYSMVR